MIDRLTPFLHRFDLTEYDEFTTELDLILGECNAVFKQGDRIGLVLDQNSSSRSYRSLIGALVSGLQQRNFEVVIFASLLDELTSQNSSASVPQFTPDKVIMLEENSLSPCNCCFEPVYLADAVRGVDALINVGTVDLSVAPYSGILPNLKHLLPGYYRSKFDYDRSADRTTARRILDLCSLLPLGLSLALVSSPASEFHSLIISNDPIYLDSYLNRRQGDRQFQREPLIREGVESGLGVEWFEESSTQITYPENGNGMLKQALRQGNRFWRRITSTSLQEMHIDRLLNAKSCDGCNECGRVCPTKAIKSVIESGNMEYNNELCIKCLCCVATCPNGVLTVLTH